QGLIPYDEKDAPFFFGREKETRLIAANLFASPLTLLYGPSGVGKSSVLRAGVAHHLRRRGDLLVVVFNAWHGRPLEDIKTAVAKVAPPAGRKKLKVTRDSPLAEYLGAHAAQLGRRLMIILDQFEEYFLYHSQDDAFAVEFQHAVMRADSPVSFLVSLREDALARLDRFKGRIPILFDNYLRIDHLDRAAGRAAVEKPVEKYNRRPGAKGRPVSVEPALVEAVLDQVATGQVNIGGAGQGVVKDGATAARIETPYLQLVLTRLWEEEKRKGSRRLRLKTLDGLGGAEKIVRTHLDTAMDALSTDKQTVAAAVFHYLVTPSGTKISHTVSDLAEYAKVPQKQLATVLEALLGGEVRILRGVAPPPDQPDAPRYEIFHDVLAAAILDWRSRYVKKQEQAEAVKKLRRERAEAKKRDAEQRRELKQAQALAKEQKRRVEEQARAAERLGRLNAKMDAERKRANEQAELARKRHAALQRVIAAIPDTKLREELTRTHLINVEKRLTGEQKRRKVVLQKAAGGSKMARVRSPEQFGMKLWENGATLRVRFMDGEPAVHERVKKFASEWTKYANLRFAFGAAPDAEIRVSFRGAGSWSYVGTDALGVPPGSPTINFGWLT
ncbi:MAG: hypothetical protein ACRD68_08655, partial [Pyrinomonadaceae bacterium]